MDRPLVDRSHRRHPLFNRGKEPARIMFDLVRINRSREHTNLRITRRNSVCLLAVPDLKPVLDLP